MSEASAASIKKPARMTTTDVQQLLLRGRAFIALILVVVSTLVAGTPVILQGTSDILILQRLPLWLVGLAATLSMVERLPEIDKTRPPGFWERRMTRLITRRNRDETTYVTPAARENGATARWNELRSEAGMKLRAELKTNGAPFRCFEV